MNATDEFDLAATHSVKAKPAPSGWFGSDGKPIAAGVIEALDGRNLPDGIERLEFDPQRIPAQRDDPRDRLRRRSQAVSDITASGQGFTVQTVQRTPKTVWSSECEICGQPFTPPEAEFLCELTGELCHQAADAAAVDVDDYGDVVTKLLECGCAGCTAYRQYVAGKWKPRGGRPRKRCGARSCEREAERRRKQRSRGTAPPTRPPQRMAWVDGYVPRALRSTSEGTGGRW